MLFIKKSKENVRTQEFTVKNNQISGIENSPDKIALRQNYQRIIAYKLTKEAQEALEVTDTLLKSVEDINIEMDKHSEHINNTVSVSNEVAAFSQEVHASVEETEKVMEETLQKARYGETSVSNAVKSIEAVESTVENMQSVIIELSQKSNKIKGIVDTIKGISKTTHLLSLNANIEAARAGEAGKGFAVVAGEVKKLADSSSRSADEIDNIIEEITTMTEGTLNIISEGMKKVRESTQIAEYAGSSIREMVDSVDRTRNISKEISNAVRNQAEKNQFLISVVDEMLEVSEKVKNFNENVAVNADRQKAALNTLKETITNLNELSQEVKSIDLNSKTEFVMSSDKPKTFDPSMATDINASNVVSPLNLGLVQFGSGIEVIGGIARSWHLEDDNVTWTFNLRKDMKFHNGRNITSKDVKFSFERLLSKKLDSPNRWFLSIIKGSQEYFSGKERGVTGIVLEGEYKLKIVLEYPYSSFINNLAHCSCSILPEEEISRIDENPVGAGLYRFVKTDEENKTIIYEKVKGHASGEALIDTIKIAHGLENPTDEFIGKKIDYLAVSAANRELLKGKNYKINTTECIGSRFICFNFRSNNPLIRSKEARQAISCCVDKERLIREAFAGYETPAKGMLPTSIISNNTITGYSRNVSRAKELLKKSGAASSTITLQVMGGGSANSSFHSKAAAILAENFKEIGITLKTIEAKPGEYYDESLLSKSDLVIYGWLGDSGTADNFIEPLIDINNAANRGRYNNPEALSLLEEAKRTKNPYKYRDIICRLEKMVVEDCPMIFLSHICVSYVQNDSIKGLKVHPLNIIKFADIWKE